jgi:hypothetical protein
VDLQPSEETARRAERALVTLLGDVGPWSRHLYLIGGMVPRYLIPRLPDGVAPHIGTLDVDLVLQVALDDPSFEAYRTLAQNLRRSGFSQVQPSFQWRRDVDGVSVAVEFICDTDAVEPGRILRRPDDGAGGGFAALNVRGANLVAVDYIEVTLEAARVDGGISRVALRVAGLLPYVTLKIFAFQDRHASKDVYDLIFCIRNFPDGPAGAATHARLSAARGEPAVTEALGLLAARFESNSHDGPAAYAQFSAADPAEEAELRNEAVAVIRTFLDRVTDET